MSMASERLPQITVHDRQRSMAIALPALQQFADRALQLCLRLSSRRKGNLTKISEVHVVLISDRRMAELHRRFLRIAGPTDVITFQHGEIFISVDTARRQARQLRGSARAEIQLYLVHGLLHLCGFDDKKPADARAMKTTQERIRATASN